MKSVQLVALLAVCSVIASAGTFQHDRQIVGQWAGPMNSVYVFKKDKTVSQTTRGTVSTGKWTINKNLLVLSFNLIGGKTFDEMRLSSKGKMTVQMMEAFKKAAGHIELTLAADGKTLSGKSPLQGKPFSLKKTSK